MSSVVSALEGVLPNVEKRGNFIRDSWDRLHRIPGGKRLFSRLVGLAAPYTGTIGAQVRELRRGYAEVSLRDRRSVRNHLDCVHAIALANLAELTGNVAVAYALPDDARFIVAGMSIDYLKKARGTITGRASCPAFESNAKAEHAIVVGLFDERGVEVARATLRTLVGPKK
ncbi:MAG: hotdog fold domain-containing protein [Sandaracinaceae bacterium]